MKAISENPTMRQLYEFGFGQAAAGYRWVKQPPALVGEDENDAAP